MLLALTKPSNCTRLYFSGTNFFGSHPFSFVFLFFWDTTQNSKSLRLPASVRLIFMSDLSRYKNNNKCVQAAGTHRQPRQREQ